MGRLHRESQETHKATFPRALLPRCLCWQHGGKKACTQHQSAKAGRPASGFVALVAFFKPTVHFPLGTAVPLVVYAEIGHPEQNAELHRRV
jgi:hypothetical protein